MNIDGSTEDPLVGPTRFCVFHMYVETYLDEIYLFYRIFTCYICMLVL